MSETPKVTSIDRPRAIPDVTIDLFGDGVERTLRYALANGEKMKAKLGKSLMGIRGGVGLLDIDEEILPVMIYEGLYHYPGRGGALCKCGHHAEDGISPDFPFGDMGTIEMFCYQYLMQKFSEAYLNAQPKKSDATTQAAVVAAIEGLTAKIEK